MIQLQDDELWFVTGSQPLYGEKVLKKVADDAKIISRFLDNEEAIPVKIVYKDVLTTQPDIKKVCDEANVAENCIGMITWMHTFSPARMWISGLQSLQKPFLHLHTQFNREIPWSEIDMDFMNLNQSAHGGREFGFMASRMKLSRKVIVGFWQDQRVIDEIASWSRAACAWLDSQNTRIARFGDNMRNVAVTEGDKVEAQIKFGYSVNGYPVGDLVECVQDVPESEVDRLIEEYEESYEMPPGIRQGGAKHPALRQAAMIELGMLHFLEDGDFSGFTTTFENLHGLPQLPGLAVQRLMARGYGFGAEGDWKTAALIRAIKVMGSGLSGGASFMEDYTYHLEAGAMSVLGAHMLEICESIAESRPHLLVEPLDIGGKADPARLVFNVGEGPAVNATIIDLGDRFRMVANEIAVVKPEKPLPKLPVARALWKPEPGLPTAAAAWILAGGAHHFGFSNSISSAHLADFAEMADIEFVLINKDTEIAEIKKELRWNDLYYKLK